MISFLPLSLLEKVVVWIICIVNNQSKFYEVFFYSSKMEDNNGLKVCWTPNNHFSSKIFSFSAEKNFLKERPTNKHTILMLLQTYTTTGELDASSSSPSPSSRGSSRTNLASHRPHGRSTRRAAVRANPFWGTNFTREEDRRKNNRHPRAPSSLCLRRNKKLNSLRTFRVKSEANDDGEFCTERVSRRLSCARIVLLFN